MQIHTVSDTTPPSPPPSNPPQSILTLGEIGKPLTSIHDTVPVCDELDKHVDIEWWLNCGDNRGPPNMGKSRP